MFHPLSSHLAPLSPVCDPPDGPRQCWLGSQGSPPTSSPSSSLQAPKGGQASSCLPQGARPRASAPLLQPRAPWASYHCMLALPVPTCACHGAQALPPVPSRHLLIEQITLGPRSPADKFPGQCLSLLYGPVAQVGGKGEGYFAIKRVACFPP